MDKRIVILALVVAAGVLLFRAFVSGWGPPEVASGPVPYGITHNETDNLSYAAWAQQAKRGLATFSDLYTTTDHDPLLFNLLFLFVGGIASLAAVSPVHVLNVLGLLAVPVFVFAIAGTCRVLKFGGATTLAVVAFALGGGGISWIRAILSKAGLGEVLAIGGLGAEFGYFDLYPALAFFIYPYQSVSLAVLAVLVFLIVRYDRGLTVSGAVLLLGVSGLLAAIRPYEPIAVLVAYGGAVLMTWRQPGALLVRRGGILGCLFVGILPFTAYALWVRSQPVWDHFAGGSLAIVGADWAAGFFVLWVLAAAGAVILGRRLLRSPFLFPSVWALQCGILLLILNSGYTKLVGGVTVALAMLAGACIERIPVKPGKVRAAVITGIMVLALASSLVKINSFARTENRLTLPAEYFDAVNAIKDASTVLTDCGTGVALPGLGGFRVYCGHWALTDGFDEKNALLSALGFGGHTGAFERNTVAALLGQIEAQRFDVVLLRADAGLLRSLQPIAAECLIHKNKAYTAMRLCPQIRDAISERASR